MSNEDRNGADSDWLTPKEISQKYGVHLRQVYRWMERSQVAVFGNKGDQRISDSSVARLRAEQEARRVVSQIIDDAQEQSGSKVTQGEIKTGIALQLASLQAERDRLMVQITNLQAERADYKQTLGELQGRLGGLEKQISRLDNDRGGLLRAVIVLFVLLVVALVVIAALIFFLKP